MSSRLFRLQGWFQTYTEGVPTIYLTITDEALITQPGDTPASVSFRPRILNAEQLSIKRLVTFWPMGNTSDQLAAFGNMLIDSYDGEFDFLYRADLRGAVCVIQLPRANMLAPAGTLASAPIIATAILANATANDDRIITVTWKDKLSLLDRFLMVRYNPPYVDSSAVNQMVPLSFGAFRNRKPQLIDGEALTYRLHDAMLGNIAVVRDMGEVLDVNSNPPRVTPAFNRSGIQLASDPAGMLLVDGSSCGSQVVVPGVVDVLAGIGELKSPTNVPPGVTTWTGPASPSTTPPSGWTYSTGLGTFTRFTGASLGIDQDWAMGITTQKIYNPASGQFGCYTFTTTPFLNPGEHYRIRIVIDRMQGPYDNVGGGFLLRTDLTADPRGDVSGPALGPYLTTPTNDTVGLFDYACPADGVTRPLYVIMVGGGASIAGFFGAWHGLTVEKLGQFAELEIEGIGFADYVYEILYNRAYEDTSSWNAADFAALDVKTNYKFGICFDQPPNILRDCILPALESICGAVFSDKTGALRACRLEDPRTITPTVRFDLSNTKRPISIAPAYADFLTTVQGGRRNWTIPGPSDFTSDFVGIPPDVRERYSRKSQYQFTSTKTPAAEYAHAINAPVFDTLGDDLDAVEAENERVVGIFSPMIKPDGTFDSGKRLQVTWTALFDDIEVVGSGQTMPAEDILLGMGATLNYPEHDFDEAPCQIHGTEIFPMAGKITLTGFF